MSRRLLQLSLALYVIACLLPALAFRDGGTDPAVYRLDVQSGGQVLGMGWMGAFIGLWGWYANPFWAVAVLLLWRQRRTAARLCALFAVVASAATFSLQPGRSIPADEANVKKLYFESFRAGCYVWLAALALTAGAAFSPAPRPPKIPAA